MRASLLLLFSRAVTPGDGGESIEDTVHLSLLNVEALVDQPAALGVGNAGGDEERGLRKIHQVGKSASVTAVMFSFCVCFFPRGRGAFCTYAYC